MFLYNISNEVSGLDKNRRLSTTSEKYQYTQSQASDNSNLDSDELEKNDDQTSDDEPTMNFDSKGKVCHA